PQVITALRPIEAKGNLEVIARVCQYLNQIMRYATNHGIIHSTFLSHIPQTEVVVKKYLEGTDKHSYYGLSSQEGTAHATGQYVAGPYVRFDWRNPNHLDKNLRNPTENPYYYIIESCVGKEVFFANFINTDMKPMGDKTISSELLHNVIDVPKTQESVLKLFYTIQYYFNKIGLEIKDVCFMLDSSGKVFWSEINQDCMRIKVKNNNDSQYDKDIWRAGGSGAKDIITKKWKEFNAILSKYFKDNRFHSVKGDPQSAKDEHSKDHKKEILRPHTYPFQKEVRRTIQSIPTSSPVVLNHEEIYER
ncbi:MAG: hypothetical protein MUO21_07945, partial [Nitrososphaeraceae archaeon]|nr:hypothetical protein [Nitrososphaeraceae archaeon]